MKHKKKYQKIVDELVVEGFPKLKNIKIRIKIKKIKSGSMRADGYITKNFVLTIDPIKYPLDKLKYATGALSHELVHFESYLFMGFFESVLLFFKYHFSKSFCDKFERKTDEIVIQRGFGKKLYFNRKFRFRRLNKFDEKIKERYMFPNEIKSYAKKIGKW